MPNYEPRISERPRAALYLPPEQRESLSALTIITLGLAALVGLIAWFAPVIVRAIFQAVS